MEKWASGTDTWTMLAKVWPDMYARSHRSGARRVFTAALGLLAACSLEVRGTGAPAAIGDDGVISEPGTVVIENGQPTNNGSKDPVPVEEKDAQADEPGASATQDAGATTSELRDAGASTDASTSTQLDAGRAPGCTLEGTYALRVAFDVNWVGSQFVGIVPIIDPGQGELSFTVLMKLSANGQGLTSSFRTCSSDVPEFVATISRERYQATFRDAVWDAPTMPTFHSSAQPACREPGCKVSFAPLTALIGTALSSATASWPDRAADGEWPDHDGDGEPGIAVEMLGPQRGQGSYAYPPLDLLSLRRVPSLGLGLRVIVGMTGELTSCDALSGPTKESSVETRAASCEAQPVVNNNPGCSGGELTFLNENLPVWTVREGSFQAKRIAAEADCKAVRRAFQMR